MVACASCYNPKAYNNKDSAKTMEQSVLSMAYQHNYLEMDEDPIAREILMMPSHL